MQLVWLCNGCSKDLVRELLAAKEEFRDRWLPTEPNRIFKIIDKAVVVNGLITKSFRNSDHLATLI